jgi:transcriptional regulator with XRE-family HTH domain
MSGENMRLKQQLEHLLDKSNMNASQLSRKANVPRQTLSNWLMGQAPKNISQVKRVADLFNVTLDHLIYGETKAEHTIMDDLCRKRFEIRIIREVGDQ